jgi:flagellar hook-length control protein FliK
MNLQLSSRAPALPATLPALNADPVRPDVTGSSAFAGLLGEQMQSRATEGRRAGERSAFDGPAARAEAPRPAPQDDRPPSRSAESSSAKEPTARRDPSKERHAPAPTSSGAAAEERQRAARKAASAGSSRAGGAQPAADREAAQNAADASAQVADEDQAADPAEQRRAQAVIDWFSRTDPTNAATKDLVTALPSGATAAPSLIAGLPSDAAVELAVLTEADGAAVAKGSAVVGAAVELREHVAHRAAAFRAGDRAAAAAALVERHDAALAGTSLATAELADKGSAVSALVTSGATDLLAPAAPAHSPTATSSPLVGSAASPAAAAAPQLLLSTPVTSPDFSQALAAQLTTLARDGIQQATLQLHPTEMGPIEVNIVLDGAQAQVDFSAAHALTRQAIESGLPSLAAALNGAGLTLSGGGVFEQRPGTPGSRTSEQDGGAPGAADGAEGELDGRSSPAPHHHVVRGLVDVYA